MRSARQLYLCPKRATFSVHNHDLLPAVEPLGAAVNIYEPTEKADQNVRSWDFTVRIRHEISYPDLRTN